MCRGVAGRSYLYSFHPLDGCTSVSYQVLARKYRPTVFADVAGQSHVLKSLINALDNQRLHHAYLFTGTRGVGKTTLARILARCLNCEAGVSSTPCGSCSACVEINEGRFVDLIEVDAASRTKVEDTRELLENVQYLPARGRYKVYLIDEVHMLSQHSFNALLKTLEEPPEHVKFLLATTDPQKLPITVLSRCLQFSLKNLSPQLIADFVAQILASEEIDNERDALWQIAMAAAGSMRDALTLTDQAIAYCEGRVLTAGVTEMLGVPPQQQITRLLEAMATRDVADVLNLIKEIGEATPDYQHSLDALLSMLHRIALEQAVPGSVDDSAGDRAHVVELAAKFSAEDVQLYYQMGLKGREDLRLAAEMRSAFEMVLLRMLVFSPQFVPLEASAGADSAAGAEQKKKTLALPKARPEQGAVSANAEGNSQLGSEASEPDSLDNAAGQSQLRSQNPTAPPAEGVGPLTGDSHHAENPGAVSIKTDSKVDQSANADSALDPGETGADAQLQLGDAVSLAAVGAAEPSAQSPLAKRWCALYAELPLAGIAANIMANCELSRETESSFDFTLGSEHSAVFSEELVDKIVPVFSAHFQRPIGISVTVGETKEETPAQAKIRHLAALQAERVAAFEKDPLVAEICDRLGGRIVVDSITQA